LLYLSEVMLQNYDLESFEDLCAIITERAIRDREIHFKMDVKPTYPDTPANWEDRLEGAFAGVNSVTF